MNLCLWLHPSLLELTRTRYCYSEADSGATPGTPDVPMNSVWCSWPDKIYDGILGKPYNENEYVKTGTYHFEIVRDSILTEL
jgi:hypothetical protein